MKNHMLLLSLCVAVLFIAVDPSNAADEKWKVFRLPEGVIACQMPGDPESERKTIDTPNGPMEVVIYKLVHPTKAFMISLAKLPPNVLKGTTAQILDNSRDGVVKSTDGSELINEKQIKIEKYPGRELLIKHPEGAYLHYRIFIVNDFLVQAIAIVESENKTVETNRFFSSLKLLKN
jgi:hypothetical protein